MGNLLQLNAHITPINKVVKPEYRGTLESFNAMNGCASIRPREADVVYPVDVSKLWTYVPHFCMKSVAACSLDDYRQPVPGDWVIFDILLRGHPWGAKGYEVIYRWAVIPYT
jgi:hypothetical protein